MKPIYKIFLFIIILFILLLGVSYIKDNTNRNAQIVFTTDVKYENYLQVAIKSLIINKSPKSIYNVTILCVDLPENDMKKFQNMSEENVVINTVPVSLELIKHVGNYEVLNHVSRADLFKFFMPEILNQYDKVLYLDSDIIVRGDLMKLYNTNIRRKYLAAVRKYNAKYDWCRLQITPKIGFDIHWPTWNYNCGILLLNLKKMREDKIPEKLILAKEKDVNKILMTQDAFNTVIPDIKIRKLHPKYNAVSRWQEEQFKSSNFKRTYFPYLIFVNSIQEIHEKAVIAHFAGYYKPWSFPNINFGQEWWKYAKMVNPNWQVEPFKYGNRI